MGVLGALLRYARPYRRLVIALVFGLIIDAAYYEAMPLSFKFLIDRAIVPKRASVLGLIVLVLVLALVVAAAAGVWRDRLFARLSSNIQNDIRLGMFAQLQRLGMDYYGSTRGGNILANFSTSRRPAAYQ
jgi:ATP-binding cassette subfamily B protein